jgi:Family of unknown function (DUF5677)/SEC-C motif
MSAMPGEDRSVGWITLELVFGGYKNPEEIQVSIARKFSRELAACDRLTDAYLARCEPSWTGRSPEGPADRIFLLETGRQTKTYRASIDLSRRGYAEQASMLNRALFESMLVVRWINENGSRAAERFDGAYRLEQHLQVERLNNTGWLEGQKLESPLTADEVKELKAKFGEYGQLMWTGHEDIRDLLSSVKSQFDDDEWRFLQNYLRVAHQENNQLLHSTAAGLGQAFTATSQGFGIWTGPSEALVGKALFVAHVIYGQALELTVDRFTLNDPEGLERVLDENSLVFKKAPADKPFPGRNEFCFCGSAKKFKKCHGA